MLIILVVLHLVWIWQLNNLKTSNEAKEDQRLSAHVLDWRAPLILVLTIIVYSYIRHVRLR
ncbi:hypothetical protein C8R47DRAFT_1205420 [Mycena vitilis]|nr:hypothetical protein C8R47DRAFT_1205420 [Mycena vitilis]